MELEAFYRELPEGDLWIFGYGSLMWAPGFAYAERRPARAFGYHRALCILSNRYRGTPERPGLVVGLRRGGSCHGMAYRVPAARVHRVLRALWRREMVTRVYRARLIRIAIGGRRVRALAFVADPGHRQYVDGLDLHARARLVAQGIGRRGRSLDYVRRTLERMAQIGVRDPHLERVWSVAQAIATQQTEPR